MDWTIFLKKEYLPIVAENTHSAAARLCSLVPKKKKSLIGGIRLSGEIIDRLLVRLRS